MVAICASFLFLVGVVAGFSTNVQKYSTIDDELFDRDLTVRKEVSTHLDLSPWELHVLADLTFKLTSLQCRKLEENAFSKYKTYVMESFRRAPRSEAQHENFLPAYSKLMSCLELLYEKNAVTDEHGVGMNARLIEEQLGNQRVQEEAISAEKDWIAKEDDAPPTSSSTNVPDVEKTYAMFSLIPVPDWLMSFIGSNPAADKASESKKLHKMKQEEKKRKQFLLHRAARQNFANIFHGMSKIIKKSCPVIHRPEKAFMRKALLDMTTWATYDQHDAIFNSRQFFASNGLLDLVNDCHKKL